MPRANLQMMESGCKRRDPCHKGRVGASARFDWGRLEQAIEPALSPAKCGNPPDFATAQSRLPIPAREQTGEPATRISDALADLARPPYIGAVSDRKKSANKERQHERLRAALRENLKRRKAQARGRALRQEPEPESHDSAGISEDKEGRG